MDPHVSSTSATPTTFASVVAVGGESVFDGLGLPWLIGGGVVCTLALALLIRSLGKRPALDVDDGAPALGGPSSTAIAAPVGLAARLRDRMARSREALAGRFDALFGRDKVDEELLEDLEEALIMADVGVPTTERILEALRARVARGETDPTVLRGALRESMRQVLADVHQPLVAVPSPGPLVVLVVGVNGSGKTTTIGKLAARLNAQGHKVMLAAGDTYRAAAAEQLEIWSTRASAEFVRLAEGADPAAVAFEALDAAAARGCDVVIIDTAGRLQTVRPLMEQLAKLRRVIDKKVPGAPHETLLVVDGTMGQNALSQARNFHEATPLTGVVVTKLDGTAKGGMVLAIASEMKLPVKLIGIGEQVDDLRDFEVDAFVDALV